MMEIKNEHLIEDAHKYLTEYFGILSRSTRHPYYVLLDYATILGEQQPLVLVYNNTGKNMFLEYCYPLTETQYQYYETHRIKGFASKNMQSGHKEYRGCHFAYAQITFALDGGLDFPTAFQYIIRQLEKQLMKMEKLFEEET